MRTIVSGKIVAILKGSKIIRGSLVERYFKCKNPRCLCQKGQKKHGPHLYISYSTEKYSRQVYVPAEYHVVVKRYISNYNKLWELIKKVSIKNIELLKDKKTRKDLHMGKKNGKEYRSV